MKNQHLWEKRLVIYTDNTNARDAFNTFAVDPAYNCLLQHAANLLLESNCQLQVLYIAGDKNQVADALSRRHVKKALQLDPLIHLFPFEPPRYTLGEFTQ